MTEEEKRMIEELAAMNRADIADLEALLISNADIKEIAETERKIFEDFHKSLKEDETDEKQ